MKHKELFETSVKELEEFVSCQVIGHCHFYNVQQRFCYEQLQNSQAKINCSNIAITKADCFIIVAFKGSDKMKKEKINGNVIFFVIARPKSDMQRANKNDQVIFSVITRRELDMYGEYITATRCPKCKSENCTREFNPVGFEHTLCKDCENELTFWCTRDKDGYPIPIDELKDLTSEYLTCKEFLLKNPYGIYIMELFIGGICGAAFENDITFSPSLNQDPNVKKITVIKIANNNIIKKVVFERPHYPLSELRQIANA